MTNFQFKYYSKTLVVFPLLGLFFIRAFDGFTRLILHIYANEEVLWNGYANLSEALWIAVLWLVHLAITFLVGMVLMTLSQSNMKVAISFASIITLHSVFNWLRLVRSDDDHLVLPVSLEQAWDSDLIPFLIYILIGIAGCTLSYQLSKANRTSLVSNSSSNK